MPRDWSAPSSDTQQFEAPISLRKFADASSPKTREVAEQAMRRVQQALDGDEGSGILWGDARHESMLADMIALMRTVQSSKNMEHGLYARMDGYIHGFCLENREFWEPLTAFWLAWLGHTAYEPRYTEMKSSDATIQLMDEASREGVWVTSSSWRVVMNSLQWEIETGIREPEYFERALERMQDQDTLDAWGIELTESDKHLAKRAAIALMRLRRRSAGIPEPY